MAGVAAAYDHRVPTYRPTLRAVATALLGVAVLVACSTSPAGVSAVSSSAPADAALGQNADVAVTRSLNANALVPGSATASPTSTAAPIPVDPEFAQVATVLATGVAAWDSGGTSLVGWALSEILTAAGPNGAGQPDQQLTTALDGLSDQIGVIDTQLTQIEAQLSKVTNQIKDGTYQIEIQDLATNHIAPLQSMWQDYNEIVSSQNTNKGDITALTGSITNPATGVSAHIEAIKETFIGSATTGEAPLPGLFSTFVVDQGVPAMDDRPLYQNYIVPYGQYFAALMVMGLALQVEAYHQQGDAAAAQQAIDTVWSDVYQVLQATGSPVSNDAAQLNIPTGNIWSTSPMCIVSAFDSADWQTVAAGSDPAQSALAWTTGAMPGWTFKAGDAVCSITWDEYNENPSAWLPEAIKASGLPTEIAAGTTDPVTLWRDPVASDISKLYADRGSASPQAYLNSIGFAIPSPSGLYGSTYLAHDFWYGSQSGYIDVTNGTDTCLFFANCPASGDWSFSFLVIATPQCFLGTGDYQGLPTACGTDWLTPIWKPTPPPPAAGPTTSTTSATSTAAPTGSTAPAPSPGPSVIPSGGVASSITTAGNTSRSDAG